MSPRIARKYSKAFCNHVDGVVAPTKKTEKLLRSYGVQKRIRIIPTGIDFTPFNPKSSPYVLKKSQIILISGILFILKFAKIKIKAPQGTATIEAL